MALNWPTYTLQGLNCLPNQWSFLPIVLVDFFPVLQVDLPPVLQVDWTTYQRVIPTAVERCGFTKVVDHGVGKKNLKVIVRVLKHSWKLFEKL